MEIEGLRYTCPACGEWFHGKEANLRKDLSMTEFSSLPKEHLYCPNHKRLIEIHDAHVYGIQTPYDAIVCRVLLGQRRALEQQIKDLNREIEQRGGEV